MKHIDYRAYTENMLMDAINKWFPMQCQNEYGMFYLYGKLGSLVISEDRPNGYDLVTTERVSPGRDKTQNFNMLRSHVYRFPCIPPEL